MDKENVPFLEKTEWNLKSVNSYIYPRVWNCENIRVSFIFWSSLRN